MSANEPQDGWSPDLLTSAMPATVLGTAAATVTRLQGGEANTTWLVELTDGTRAVVKGGQGAPPGLFRAEAEGLNALREHGLPTPDVLGVGERSLVLRALNAEPPEDEERFWERAGRAVALLHGHTTTTTTTNTGPRFGWQHDGWLGRLPQRNGWDADGHRFFAENRILRYLPEPAVRRALDARDLAALERLCGRLTELVPPSPAVLTHGDLWRNNVIADDASEPVFIDPAVCWMWAEAELSMAYCTGGIPDRFFDAYHEIRPPVDGWRERMELLNLRELLSVLAHFGPVGDCAERVRNVTRRFG